MSGTRETAMSRHLIPTLQDWGSSGERLTFTKLIPPRNV